MKQNRNTGAETTTVSPALAKLPVSRRLSKWDKGFSAGFAAACAIILSQHGEDSIVEDCFKCNFMDEATMRRHGVDEFDIQILKPIIKEIKRKQ